MYRFLHFCFIVVLIYLTNISLEIPKKIYGSPDWYSEQCRFSNWKNPIVQVDCSTNIPVTNYYTGKSVHGMRESDRDEFFKLLNDQGCVIAGVDYYALTALTPIYFPKLFEQHSDDLANGSVFYLKICLKDGVLTSEIIGRSNDENH